MENPQRHRHTLTHTPAPQGTRCKGTTSILAVFTQPPPTSPPTTPSHGVSVRRRALSPRKARGNPEPGRESAHKDMHVEQDTGSLRSCSLSCTFADSQIHTHLPGRYFFFSFFFFFSLSARGKKRIHKLNSGAEGKKKISQLISSVSLPQIAHT